MGWVFFPALAFASITVSSPNAGHSDEDEFHYAAYNSSLAITAGGGAVDTENGKRIFTLRTSAGGNRAEMLLFDIESDKTADTGEQLIVVVYARDSDGTAQKVPIQAAALNSSATSDLETCSASLCQDEVGDSDQYYAVKYTTNETLRIGIFPQEFCERYSDGDGCDGTDVALPTDSSAATAMDFEFIVRVAASTSSSDAASDSSDESSDRIDLKYYSIGPANVTCSDLSSIYFPGDSEILVDTDLVSLTANSGSADASRVVVIGNISATNDTTSSLRASNNVSAELEYQVGEKPVTGFSNSSDTVSNEYEVFFTIRDKAGFLYNDGTTYKPSGCSITGVRTSEILGFLRQNYCFIATAAYREKDHWGIDVLRAFRDQWLLSSPLGRSLVEAYYRWSPQAAVWLIENKEWRWPVLALLFPVQVVAWLFLQGWLGLFILASLFLGVGFAYRMRRRGRFA